MIYGSVADLIGKTPLLRLSNIERELAIDAELVAKLEYLNPAGSVKDRAARQMLDDAEAAGLITAGSTIIEPTSGNTGIGLAVIGGLRGYRVIIVMPDTMSLERRRLLTAYGAELVLTDGSLGMRGAIEEAERLRLVEEQEQRKKEEEERLRREQEAEEARLRHEMEVEQERIRQEQEAEEQRLLIERMEREQEDRRRANLFRKEINLLWDTLEEKLYNRKKLAALQEAGLPEDYADAAAVLEEAERLRQEAIARERQRSLEEEERKRHEERLAEERARREEEDRLDRLRREQKALEQARDMAAVASYAQSLEVFRVSMQRRLGMRAADAEKKRREQEAREAERLRRQQTRESSAQ